MANTKEWTTAYRFFFDYFENGMDAVKTISAYGLLGPGRHNRTDYSYKWGVLKKQYSEEYQNAKNDYMESVGIHSASIWQKVYDIAQFANRDADKLKALELLIRYREEIGDSALVKAANTLQIEVVKPPELELEEV